MEPITNASSARATEPPLFFYDRRDAGRHLADHLLHYRDNDVLALALPRGGVPVGYEIARALHALLDVFLVRKPACRVTRSWR